MFGWWRDRKRQGITEQPFPAPWRETLERDVAFWPTLSEEEQQDLEGQIQVFIAEKNFEGCGGLQLDEAMPVVVAANACLLQLGIDLDFFPRLQSILLYPDVYQVPDRELDEAGVVRESDEARLGESWDIGAIVLSWADAIEDSRKLDGHNVILHEFAHQIDRADGASDGWPDPIEDKLHDRWLEVMAREFEQLQDDLDANRRTRIDPYGAENPAEFFAVLTEQFFTDPKELHRYHEELYDLFRAFYQQDTLVRFS
jgi:MtfA peptidase